MSDYQYQAIIKTQDNEVINTLPLEESGLSSKWSEMINKAEARADYIVTLQKRFVDKNPDPVWLELWKQQRESFLMVNDNMVVGKWSTIAEVNTKYH